METGQFLNKEILVKLANAQMPFGRYKGTYLIDLPEPYVVWFSQAGFPPGELGQLLSVLYEVKLNGLERVLQPLRKQKNIFYGRR